MLPTPAFMVVLASQSVMISSANAEDNTQAKGMFVWWGFFVQINPLDQKRNQGNLKQNKKKLLHL